MLPTASPARPFQERHTSRAWQRAVNGSAAHIACSSQTIKLSQTQSKLVIKIKKNRQAGKQGEWANAGQLTLWVACAVLLLCCLVLKLL
jgi:hypothetical protein